MGDLPVYELAALLEMQPSAVSHALRLLRAHDVVGSRREGKTVIYFLRSGDVTAIQTGSYSDGPVAWEELVRLGAAGVPLTSCDSEPEEGWMRAEAVTHGPGEGRNFSIGPDQAWVRVESNETNDAFSVIEYEAAPGVPGPPLHVHKIVSETWYILDGEVEFRAGDTTLRAKAGTSVHVPPGIPHTFANVGKGSARWIGIFSPGRFVKLVEEIGKAFGSAGGPPDESLLAEAFANYDMQVVEQ